MDPDHPFIAFLLAREANGRFEQISDRSYVKHGFFALSSTFCSACIGTDGTRLGLGCSDTYSVGNNGDNFWLGPPAEIDPWLGLWDPVCSHFDRGEPAVAPPNDCNGARSLTSSQANALGSVGHRIRVRDADFNVPGAFWFQGMYVIETEGDRVREDNLASRAFVPSWTGSSWNLVESGVQLFGSVLQRWAGASVKSSTNGTDDGRLFVAVKVGGQDQTNGTYHYEYAVHNRDNRRGVGALRIPICASARVMNLGFGDIDQEAGNDWSASVVGNEIVFSGPSNPLAWNTIYNFWFDSDAAPVLDTVELDQASAGPGAAFVSVTSSAPLALYNVYLGPGCDFDPVPPTLFANGRATLGNAAFALYSGGNTPFMRSYLRFSITPGSHVRGGCTRYLGPGPAFSLAAGNNLADATGLCGFSAPIPSDIAYEGLNVSMQTLSRDPSGGPVRSFFDLSDGLLVRLGNAVPDCP
ncbi:MAG: hypothetical protein HOP15_04790 [Planctomycetes bacterium]|nr:hypothetical protein [Planctomycetota bacterium]